MRTPRTILGLWVGLIASLTIAAIYFDKIMGRR